MQVDEPTLRDQLLADYDEREDRIDRAANVELWELGDWLAQYVPNAGHGGDRSKSTRPDLLRLDDLAGRRGRSRSWLHDLRKVAEATVADRLPLITPRVYLEAMRQAKWDLVAANQSLITTGHRLRDQSGPMESVDALTRQLDKRTPEERAEVAVDLMADPTVRELVDSAPLPDFADAWVDRIVVNVSEQAHKLASQIQREGLRFSPDADMASFLRMLEAAERRIADVRAAVQERVRDAAIEATDGR
jgi:hypothetical protein